MCWDYQEIKSSVYWSSPIKQHMSTTASDPTQCARAQDMWIQLIQVEGTNLGQVTDTRSWDVELADYDERWVWRTERVKSIGLM